MAVWAIKPGCFLWPTADVTGGGFNGTADDIDECLSNPCLSGGTCSNRRNRYDCNCTADHYGSQCQYTVVGSTSTTTPIPTTTPNPIITTVIPVILGCILGILAVISTILITILCCTHCCPLWAVAGGKETKAFAPETLEPIYTRVVPRANRLRWTPARENFGFFPDGAEVREAEMTERPALEQPQMPGFTGMPVDWTMLRGAMRANMARDPTNGRFQPAAPQLFRYRYFGDNARRDNTASNS